MKISENDISDEKYLKLQNQELQFSLEIIKNSEKLYI